MQQQQNLLTDRRFRIIILTSVVILTAGLSGLLYPSTYAPLILLGMVVSVAIFSLYLWKPEFALYSALLVVLLPGGFIPQNIQSPLNRLLTLVALGVWCIDIIFRGRRVVMTTSTVLMIGFVWWSIVTLFWAEHLNSALTTIQVYTLRLLLFLILIPNEINTKQKLDGLFKTIALVGWILVISSSVTLLQQGYRPGTRFALLDANENAIGTVALVASLGVLWLGTYRSNKFPVNILPVLYIALMIGLIAVTGSRGSMLSLLIALLAFSYEHLTRRWAKISLAIGLLILIVAPATFLTTFERFMANSSDSLGIIGGRASLWRGAWQMILDHPFLGVGIGGSSYAILPYLATVSASVGRVSISIHNPILVIWSQTGLPGLLLYLSVLVGAVWSFIRQYYLYQKRKVDRKFLSYFALTASIFLGYMASWIKGGGAEADHIYFLLLALLIIPSCLDVDSIMKPDDENHPLTSAGTD